MDSPDQRGAVSKVIAIFRKMTRIVQLLPFVYVALFAAYLVAGSLLPDEALCLADSIFLVSPSVGGALLVLSRVMGLCRWHRLACLIPGLSQVEGVIDTYLFTFSEVELVVINASIAAVSVIYLLHAIRHFAYGRKAIPARTA